MSDTLNLFLSYPHEQLSWAVKISEFLEDLDLNVWFDKKVLVGGQSWDRERENAQAKSDVTIIVWSCDLSQRSGVVWREIKTALARHRDMAFRDISIIVCRATDTEVPQELREFHYINLFKGDWHFELCRSISLKHAQACVQQTPRLVEFLEKKQIRKSVKLKSYETDADSVICSSEYILYQNTGDFWSCVNAEITLIALSGYYQAIFQGRSCLNDHVRQITWSMHVAEHFSTQRLVSLSFFQYSDWGGAHPTLGIFTRNFDETAGGKLDLAEIFERNPVVFDYLKQACEADVNRQIVVEEGKSSNYSLDNYIALDYGDNWGLFSQWGFSESDLTIWIGEFSGLPHVMGMFEVNLPWSFLRDKVALAYAETELGRLIKRRFDPS